MQWNSMKLMGCFFFQILFTSTRVIQSQCTFWSHSDASKPSHFLITHGRVQDFSGGRGVAELKNPGQFGPCGPNIKPWPPPLDPPCNYYGSDLFMIPLPWECVTFLQFSTSQMKYPLHVATLSNLRANLHILW